MAAMAFLTLALFVLPYITLVIACRDIPSCSPKRVSVMPLFNKNILIMIGGMFCFVVSEDIKKKYIGIRSNVNKKTTTDRY